MSGEQSLNTSLSEGIYLKTDKEHELTFAKRQLSAAKARITRTTQDAHLQEKEITAVCDAIEKDSTGPCSISSYLAQERWMKSNIENIEKAISLH